MQRLEQKECEEYIWKPEALPQFHFIDAGYVIDCLVFFFFSLD